MILLRIVHSGRPHGNAAMGIVSLIKKELYRYRYSSEPRFLKGIGEVPLSAAA